mmetsp:Transcript_14534/g.21593  ORF Transcript_14534/g.21593 Transcript_14534/m.21593 type:complete len:99 (+) Transcript_14534:95-391(+)
MIKHIFLALIVLILSFTEAFLTSSTPKPISLNAAKSSLTDKFKGSEGFKKDLKLMEIEAKEKLKGAHDEFTEKAKKESEEKWGKYLADLNKKVEDICA